MSRGSAGELDVLDPGEAMSPAGGLGRRALKAFAALRGLEPARAGAWTALGIDIAGAPRRAATTLERAVKKSPGDAAVRMWLGQALLELQQYGRAARELAAARALFKRPPHVLLLLQAVARYHVRDWEGAARGALEAVADDPASPAAYVLLSRVRQRQGRPAEALAACHKARDRDLEVGASFLLPKFGKDPWADARGYLRRLDRAIKRAPTALLYAERAELKRDPRLCLYVEALRDYEEAARRAPKAAWMRALVGRAKNNASGGEAGLEDFDRAVALAPESGWIRAWRGAALTRMGRSAEAHADFAAAEKRMPWYPYTYAWRGALLVREGRFSRARADLERAVPLDPNYIFSRFERFKARLALGEYEGAVADLLAARRADPKFDWPSRDRALLEKAVRARPDLGWLRAWRGRALLAEGDAKGALRELAAAIARLPREADPLVWRGEALARLGRAAEAKRDLEAAVRLAPRSWSAHRALADLLAASGRTREALARMRRVTALAPTTVSHLVDRARLEAALNLTKAALASLERALELEPRYAKARALTFVIRGMARGRRGDAAGQAADFRQALAIEPALFSDEERRAIEAAG